MEPVDGHNLFDLLLAPTLSYIPYGQPCKTCGKACMQHSTLVRDVHQGGMKEGCKNTSADRVTTGRRHRDRVRVKGGPRAHHEVRLELGQRALVRREQVQEPVVQPRLP